jgi:hypothetical protein
MSEIYDWEALNDFPGNERVILRMPGIGEQSVAISEGQRFSITGSDEWEALELTGYGVYSHSKLDGTPVLKCRLVSGTPREDMLNYIDESGVSELSADSVAFFISCPIRPIADQP